jgi:TetR/AcrR family transcriptional regulator
MRAARVEFSTKGMSAATGAIVGAAGVTQPALYHHFGSKRDLFLAVVEDTYATVLRRFDEWIPPDAPFARSVDLLLDCSVSVMREDPSLAAMISTVQFEIRRDPALADELRPTLARFRAFFDGLARRAPSSAAIDPRSLSRVLVTLIAGLNSQALLLPDAHDFPAVVEALRVLLRSGTAAT